MSYDRILLVDSILTLVERDLAMSLCQLSLQLGVSTRTIETAIKSTTGKTFRKFHQDMVLARVIHLLISQPSLSIKELSFDVGYSSARSLARRIRSVSGLSPKQLRSALAHGAQEVGQVALARTSHLK